MRGFPNGIFNPWARWISGLALAWNSSVIVVDAAVVALWAGQENRAWKLMKFDVFWVAMVAYGLIFGEIEAAASRKLFNYIPR